ncbi:hypothetical protein [Endozoicomonas sp. 8E]|uniref:hypothetical protein n=1 Tax=Endozoicomonas sp. 8E TaxID=3035692 RepID=UPI002938E6A0|nr:hypothetical protein [Endozoicomonas sp. 8E]WOG27032.1 hypothetical protein P6910_21145 [Endozoicomonas sp. 8E]
MLFLLSVTCQAEPWTGGFTIEFEKNTACQEQNFYIKNDRLTLPGTPPDNVNLNDYERSASLPDNKRKKPFSYGVKTTIVESIYWQWLYTTNLLVACGLIMTTKAPPPGSTPYFWIPVEMIAAVGWLLKNYWNPDLPLYNPIEQQTASMLTQGDHPFATIITMYGSRHNLPEYQPPESSGQQAPKANAQPAGSLTNPLYSDNADGNGAPEQLTHNLGLNCFVHPCHGVCRFRPSSDGRGPTEWTLNSEEGTTNITVEKPGQSPHSHFVNGHCPVCISDFDQLSERQTHQPDDGATLSHLTLNADDLIIINGLLNLRHQSPPEESGVSWKLTRPPPPVRTSETQQTATYSPPLGQNSPHLYQTETVKVTSNDEQQNCGLTMAVKDSQLKPCGTISKNASDLSAHKSEYHARKKICDVIMVGKSGLQQPCRRVCKHASALLDHKRRYHSGQQTCDVIVVMEDGQQQPCGKVCKNAEALSTHKRRYHTGQQTCEVTVIGENGQQKCGKVFMNAKALSNHKSTCHSRRQTCKLTVVQDGGQPRPCGKVCDSSIGLADHKYKHHSGQKTCYVTVVGEDGLQRRCGTVWKNPNSLMNHKRRQHTEEQTCYVTVIGRDGRQRQCGKVLKNTCSLADHRYKYHSGYHTCHMTVVGEDSLPRQCGMVWMNANSLTNHKRRCHTGQQICEVTLVRENGQLYSCGKLLNNAKALSDHKRIHRKRKPVDTDRDKNLNP